MRRLSFSQACLGATVADRLSFETLISDSPAAPMLEYRSQLIVLNTVAEERDWRVEFVPSLRVLGELVANALLRAPAFESVQTAHDDVKRLRDRLEREKRPSAQGSCVEARK